MDARAHVQAGLVRLLKDESMWPVPERQRFLHRLLDEVGSDHRALATLLLRVHDAGVPERLRSDARAGVRWGESAMPHIVGMTSEHFIQPEMARWAVESWGMALGHYVAPPVLAAPAPMPRVTTTRASAAPQPWRGAGATPAQGGTAVATRTGFLGLGAAPVAAGAVRPNPPGTPSWVKPGKVSPTPKYIAGSLGGAPSAPAPGSVTLPWLGVTLSPGELRGLLLLGGCYAFGMTMLFVGIRSVREDELPGARATVASASAAASGARVASPPAVTGGLPRLDPSAQLGEAIVAERRTGYDSAQAIAELRARRRDSLAALARRARTPVRPMIAPPLGSGANVNALAPERADDVGIVPDAMRAWRGRYDPASADVLVAGRWRVRSDVAGVSGSPSCEAVWRSLLPGRESVETLTIAPLPSPAGDVDFAFTSRPGLRGTIARDGTFQTVTLRNMREGMRYEFRMVGRFAEGAFEAETETVTGTVLKYGDPQVCSVRSRLSGRRVGGHP